MKPISSYSSIQAIGHRMVDDILDGHVVVQEKIDGSQISFGLFEGELGIRSKNAMRSLDEDGMFKKAIENINSAQKQKFLVPGYTYRGEYLQKPKHNTKKYDRVPKGNIVLFDIDGGNQHYLSTEEVAEEAQNLGFEPVRTIYQGDECTVDMLEKIVDEEKSQLGDEVPIEGVVVKNYSKFGSDNKIMMAKLVSDDFKERHQKDWKQRNPGPIERIVEEINQEAVWNKAIQHLRDKGVLVNEPKDIGPLMTEIKTDLFREQEEYIKEVLYNHYKKDIFNRIKRGFPEFYKKLLRDRVREE